eukprot:TRINITY_DN15724_c0_g1_i1.p1 TRINITY_DN15724_c0_g1~~TRINITY_DN15724_c0_g1_i1.p1  ORF type:complete len:147 (-),score=25.86 TRINITY_DN15724_c0_g1_i1:232-672(-)
MAKVAKRGHPVKNSKESVEDLSELEQLKADTYRILTNRMLDTAATRCFKICVAKPSQELSRGEESCLSRCSGHFMDAFSIVANAYSLRMEEVNAYEERQFDVQINSFQRSIRNQVEEIQNEFRDDGASDAFGHDEENIPMNPSAYR